MEEYKGDWMQWTAAEVDGFYQVYDSIGPEEGVTKKDLERANEINMALMEKMGGGGNISKADMKAFKPLMEAWMQKFSMLPQWVQDAEGMRMMDPQMREMDGQMWMGPGGYFDQADSDFSGTLNKDEFMNMSGMAD